MVISPIHLLLMISTLLISKPGNHAYDVHIANLFGNIKVSCRIAKSKIILHPIPKIFATSFEDFMEQSCTSYAFVDAEIEKYLVPLWYMLFSLVFAPFV